MFSFFFVLSKNISVSILLSVLLSSIYYISFLRKDWLTVKEEKKGKKLHGFYILFYRLQSIIERKHFFIETNRKLFQVIIAIIIQLTYLIILLIYNSINKIVCNC